MTARIIDTELVEALFTVALATTSQEAMNALVAYVELLEIDDDTRLDIDTKIQQVSRSKGLRYDDGGPDDGDWLG